MADFLKTYRVVRGTLKVGDSVRQFGDFVPEADSWPNKEVYLKTGYIEIVYVPNEEFKKNAQDVLKRNSGVTSQVSEHTPKSKKRIVKRSKKNVGAEADGGSVLSEQAI